MPGLRLTIRYCPAPSLAADRTFSINAGLAASTVTPGITAPVASLTVPAIVCACPAVAAPSTAATAAKMICVNLVIVCAPLTMARRRLPPSMIRGIPPFLKLELPADFEQPALQHVGGPHELIGRRRRERRVDRVDEVAVEHVIEVGIRVEAVPANLQAFGQPQIELVQISPPQRARLD